MDIGGLPGSRLFRQRAVGASQIGLHHSTAQRRTIEGGRTRVGDDRASHRVRRRRGRAAGDAGRGRVHSSSRRLSRPNCCGRFAPPANRGRGECRAAGRNPWPACRRKSRRQSPQVQPDQPGIPRAMVFTLIRDLPGVRLDSHRRPWGSSSPRTWRQRRGARTTRFHVRKEPFVRALSKHAATHLRPPHPAPNVRDDREAPLSRSTGWTQSAMEFGKSEVEYFWRGDWTGVIALRDLMK